MNDFIAKKREIFLVQMSLDTKRAEITKLEERALQVHQAPCALSDCTHARTHVYIWSLMVLTVPFIALCQCHNRSLMQAANVHKAVVDLGLDAKCLHQLVGLCHHHQQFTQLPTHYSRSGCYLK